MGVSETDSLDNYMNHAQCTGSQFSYNAFMESYLGASQILLGLPVQDEYVRRLHELFLNTRRREKDMIALSNGYAAARASHPTMTVELIAQGADVVGGMMRFGRCD